MTGYNRHCLRPVAAPSPMTSMTSMARLYALTLTPPPAQEPA